MATHSSTLAQTIPWTEETGRQQSMGSQRAMTDFSFFLSFCTFTAVCPGSVPGWGTKIPQAVQLNKQTQSPCEFWQIQKIHLNTEASRNSKSVLKEYIETRNDNGDGLCYSMQFLFLTQDIRMISFDQNLASFTNLNWNQRVFSP